MELARILRDLWIIDGRIGVIPKTAGMGWSDRLESNQWRAFDRLLAWRTNPAVLSRLFLYTVSEGIDEPCGDSKWAVLLADACDILVPLWDALLFETGLEWPDDEDFYYYWRPMDQLARRAPAGLRQDHRLMMAQRLLSLRTVESSDHFAEPDDLTELAERLAGMPFSRIALHPLDPSLVARRDALTVMLRSGDVESVLPDLDAIRDQEPAAAACLAVYLLRGWRVDILTGPEALEAAPGFAAFGLTGSRFRLKRRVASPADPRLSRWLADSLPVVAFLHGIDIGRHTAEDLDDADRIVAALLDEHTDWRPELERSLGGSSRAGDR